jgi:hypothetical protein
MRNLHLENIRYDTPSLMVILDDLSIEASPELDRDAIRRFLMGHLLTSIKDPVRRDMVRNIEIPLKFDNSGGVDDFFKDAKQSLLATLECRGVDLSASKETLVQQFNNFGVSMFDIFYTSPETESEMAKRQRYVYVFNQLLLHKDAIYKNIDNQASE